MSCGTEYNAKYSYQNEILTADLSTVDPLPSNFDVDDLKNYEHSAIIQGQKSPNYPAETYTDVPDIVVNINFNTLRRSNLFVLNESNLSAGATVRLQQWGQNGQIGTLKYDSGEIGVKRNKTFYEWDFWFDPFYAPFEYTRNIGKFKQWYFDTVAAASARVTIHNPNNPNGFNEINSLWIGQSFTTNSTFQFGFSRTATDTSEHILMEDGSTIASRGIDGDTLAFEYNSLSTADRARLEKFTDVVGTHQPFFIDSFPADVETSHKERRLGIFMMINQVGYTLNKDRSYANESHSFSTNFEMVRV